MEATEQKKNRKRGRDGLKEEEEGRAEGEVLRPERARRTGIRGGQREQISMEMETGIGGTTGRTGGINGAESEALVEKGESNVWPRFENWRSVGRRNVPERRISRNDGIKPGFVLLLSHRRS